jgi:flagellar protein FliS
MYATTYGGAAAARARFVDDALSTATPAQLLTRLYDRLVLDLLRGEQALRAGERAAANAQLQHAQDIVAELLSSLDTSAWEGGPGLASLYAYLLTELVAANVAGDAERVAACRGHVEPLRDAWHEAARLAVPTSAVAVGQVL